MVEVKDGLQAGDIPFHRGGSQREALRPGIISVLINLLSSEEVSDLDLKER